MITRVVYCLRSPSCQAWITFNAFLAIVSLGVSQGAIGLLTGTSRRLTCKYSIHHFTGTHAVGLQKIRFKVAVRRTIHHLSVDVSCDD